MNLWLLVLLRQLLVGRFGAPALAAPRPGGPTTTGGSSSGPRDAAASSPTHPPTTCGGSGPTHSSGKASGGLLLVQQREKPCATSTSSVADGPHSPPSLASRRSDRTDLEAAAPPASTAPWFSPTKKRPDQPPSTCDHDEDGGHLVDSCAGKVKEGPKARKTVHFVLPSGLEPSSSSLAPASGRGNSSPVLKRPLAMIDGEHDEVPSPHWKRFRDTSKVRECEEAEIFRRLLALEEMAEPDAPSYSALESIRGSPWANEMRTQLMALFAEDSSDTAPWDHPCLGG